MYYYQFTHTHTQIEREEYFECGDVAALSAHYLRLAEERQEEAPTRVDIYQKKKIHAGKIRRSEQIPVLLADIAEAAVAESRVEEGVEGALVRVEAPLDHLRHLLELAHLLEYLAELQERVDVVDGGGQAV